MGSSPPGSNGSEHARFELRHRNRDLAEVERGLFAALTQHQHDEASSFAIRLAIEEAVANAFHHGNRNDPAKSVTVTFRVDRERVVVDVRDQGEGFDPGAVPDPTEPENVEIPSGRGIVLMRAYMSDVRFLPPGNHVRMTYHRPGSASE